MSAGILSFGPTARTSAGLVQPGHTLSVNTDTNISPGGELVAEDAEPFFVVYIPSNPDAPPALVGATLLTDVFRDASSGFLTFSYQVDYGGLSGFNAAAAARLTATGYRSVSTDVTGMLANDRPFDAFRSSAGEMVGIKTNIPGEGNPIRLVVHTNAREMDSGGTLTFEPKDKVKFDVPGIPSEWITGQGTVSDILHPAGLGGDQGHGQTPNPIPLPPAALPALGTLVLGALMARRIRRAGNCAV